MNGELDHWLSSVESLKDCPDWDADEQPVEIKRTHISVVLLGRRHVLKFKKPVNLGFLDYTTLEKRREACENEVRLNSRLCDGVYLGVQAISKRAGKLRFSATGSIVEYGVLMKRLPDEQMLDRLVARGEVAESVIERVARKLGNFHRSSRRGPDVDAFGAPDVIDRNWRENFDQTARFVERTISRDTFDAVRQWVTGWLSRHQDLLRKRVVKGRIRDGHGDVRSESICITDGLCIFDCIEFNERFRYADVASEVAFLAMDLDARGRPDLGYLFSEEYEKFWPDARIFEVMPFYRCYRAYVRGKVQSFRLEDMDLTLLEREAAAVRARRYFDLAARYASRLSRRSVIIVSGLSGTGKTAIARALAGELGLRVISSDSVRKALFRIDSAYEYGEGPYGPDATRRTYREMIDRARSLLASGGSVVLDATFKRKADRMSAREMAIGSGAEFRVIECLLPPEVAFDRLERRESSKEGLSDATWSTYSRQRLEFEPLDDRIGPLLRLETNRDLAVAAYVATDWLRDNDR